MMYNTALSTLQTSSSWFLPCGTASLGAASVELNLVNGPDSSFYVLHSHKAFVETEIVSHGVLT